MGKNGHKSPSPIKRTPIERSPHSKPPFTISDLKKAIPPHCFERSLVRSLSYVVVDLIFVFAFYYAATTYIHRLPSPFRFLAWAVYWILQGSVCTGVWVIAHECGHHGFSDYQWIDDTVGLILHSALLVPYFSWKYSHRRHHANTGSIDNDEVYIPKPMSEIPWYAKYSNNPFGRLIILATTLTLGFPLYLAFNVSGRPYDRSASHYDPYSPIYNDHERIQIYVSDAGILLTMYVLLRVAMAKGLVWLMCVYGVPLLIVNAFFVSITYLHHTHRVLPHYDSSEWDWLRGALATCDRDYGVLNAVFHNVTITHVAHHLFATIPHYHALEATEAIKPILGPYYHFDGTPFYKAMWREANECLYVEKDENAMDKGVFWYKNKLS